MLLHVALETEEFNPKTGVWTVRLTRDGAPAAISEEDLIFNFYGWQPPTWPEAINQTFLSRLDNAHPGEHRGARQYNESASPLSSAKLCALARHTATYKSARSVPSEAGHIP